MSDLADLHVARINRAIDFVLEDLARPFDLEQVARVAHFSPFHFHRVFKGAVGETLAAFVKRVRLQRAIHRMAHDPEASLTEIALACGFSSSSEFSRSFKQRYGVPPRAFDLAGHRDAGRERLSPDGRLERLPPGANPDGFRARIRELPPRFVAYVRVHRPFTPGAPQAAAHALRGWAAGREVGAWLGFMWDDPEVVPLEQCRYDVGVEVPERFHPEGAVGCVAFPAMTVAAVEVLGPIALELRALDWLYGTWLPRSRYAPADLPCFEVWRGLPFAHGDDRFELDLQLPVVAR